MSYFKNKYGQWYHRSQHGCYPVNDGDPQNDDPEFDKEEAERAYEDAIDRRIDAMENR